MVRARRVLVHGVKIIKEGGMHSFGRRPDYNSSKTQSLFFLELIILIPQILKTGITGV